MFDLIPDDKYLRLIEEELKILKALRFKALSEQNKKIEEKEVEKSDENLPNHENILTSESEIDFDFDEDKHENEDEKLDFQRTCNQNEELIPMKTSNNEVKINSKYFCFPQSEPLFTLIEQDVCLLDDYSNKNN